MEEIIKQIIDWGNEKGINNPTKQFNKLAEEMLEAHEAYIIVKHWIQYKPQLLHNPLFNGAIADFETWKHLKEELGDIGVVWILLCNMLDVDPLEALEAAHNKNKDRKGKTINGSFVKEEDLADE